MAYKCGSFATETFLRHNITVTMIKSNKTAAITRRRTVTVTTTPMIQDSRPVLLLDSFLRPALLPGSDSPEIEGEKRGGGGGGGWLR